MSAKHTPGQELRTLIDRAVDVLQRHAPPDGLSDHDAMSEFYAIFDGPEYQDAIANAAAPDMRQFIAEFVEWWDQAGSVFYGPGCMHEDDGLQRIAAEARQLLEAES